MKTHKQTREGSIDDKGKGKGKGQRGGGKLALVGVVFLLPATAAGARGIGLVARHFVGGLLQSVHFDQEYRFECFYLNKLYD